MKIAADNPVNVLIGNSSTHLMHSKHWFCCLCCGSFRTIEIFISNFIKQFDQNKFINSCYQSILYNCNSKLTW